MVSLKCGLIYKEDVTCSKMLRYFKMSDDDRELDLETDDEGNNSMGQDFMRYTDTVQYFWASVRVLNAG